MKHITLGLILGALFTISGCASFRTKTSPVAPVAKKKNIAPIRSAHLDQSLSIPSMGTVWKINFETSSKSVVTKALRTQIRDILEKYDATFSDWRHDSELRRLERKGLTQVRKPTPFFLEGLSLAKRMGLWTKGHFDITVGAVIWKQLEKPVGIDTLVLDPDGKVGTFRFTQDPKRLTFDGVIKGTATGEVAAYLWKSGFHNFELSAGSGNMVVAGEGCDGGICFVSNSRSRQGKQQHIFDPNDPRREIKLSTQVRCRDQIFEKSSADELKRQWKESGSVADVLSKVIMIDPDFTDIPPNCDTQVSSDLD